ncbi:GNAT family N-acetyltransferase [Acinetobacter dispersus]|uniref:GNAT family N-acetyltransferase n=1 Tax=Acinetobacter dispersus TaxID=70348 RepID=UPI001F4BBB96|nr:GNAT family N-acetyltransferase [Acinetobacter dispersus]MCH7389026.1 GNAT family N-acetyltransferase [Acinetobacter dispersus]
MQMAMTNTLDLVVREATLEDDKALRQLVGVPMTTRGVMLSFQREPCYFQAAKVIYEVNDHVVVEDRTTKKLLACYSNGSRKCYVNGHIFPMRYACDLRVDQQYRGKTLLKLLGERLNATMYNPSFNQIIIFNDNYAARTALQTGRTGLPDYYDDGLVETLTLTGFKTAHYPKIILIKTKGQLDLSKVSVVTAQPEYIERMNQFVKKMAEFYNFIPAYNFYRLLKKDEYFKNLSLHDFQLYLMDGEIVGMFGLWNQSAFKQSKILHYHWSIGLTRPLYNLLARWSGLMTLPKIGSSFKYHALHSLLCHPECLSLHDRMLRDALKLSRQQGIGCISYTLSHQDPRQKLNQFYKGELLTGMHGFLSYQQDPRALFDHKRIPYFEVGRI